MLRQETRSHSPSLCRVRASGLGLRGQGLGYNLMYYILYYIIVYNSIMYWSSLLLHKQELIILGEVVLANS